MTFLKPGSLVRGVLLRVRTFRFSLALNQTVTISISTHGYEANEKRKVNVKDKIEGPEKGQNDTKEFQRISSFEPSIFVFHD